MAAGCAPFNGGYAQLDPALVSLTYNGTPVLVAGAPQNIEPRRRRRGLHDRARPRPRRRAAPGYLTSDLSYEYVRINADYRS